ncbi:protoporphyrin ix magnesium chelatase [Leptolyngbya sp. Heron Island J]|uniref:magnesium chelatase subunit H n=1 Tax=Leptolyngbya sp. Heron Island J TaxID=1385935 RepID=UPI0003B9CD90|nr:magnesium chelatase subunit H [Leptolyngbya sp. Heron Island J]ESA35646.1 protoporphyrin ix magnesium chelatase [Leptolyngbya sp. Heron Island J]
MPRIVLIAGFEAFNTQLYQQSADLAQKRCLELDIRVFCDRDLTTQPNAIAAALDGADVFFASLIFDYDQVLWLRERAQKIPIRLVFESALELMALTQLGKFVIGEKPKGMPKPVQFILSKFGSGKEEDKLAGYISFLKIGPKLLKYIPARKVQDLRNWLIIYGYWNAGGTENVASMLWVLAEKYLGLTVGEIPAVMETPNIGLLHPDYEGYFESPQAYVTWYEQTFSQCQNKPRVGILLYRKHVITKQAYIPQLIRYFEEAGLVPVPIFINGVEGHVAVRDLMTTSYEQTQRALGHVECASLSKEAVQVDAIVSTIGFPLVGGPAGSMEAGRQVAVAKKILGAKNVPYFVAAPLLIQDIHSWTRQGIGGLQSVVLYALPELDGAIDPIPLGGLVGDQIYLVPERVRRLTGRVKQWIELRRKERRDRKLAIILYGFPPGYGAIGTAALLNVPKSLLALLEALKTDGYHVGELPNDGETIIDWVKAADDENQWMVKRAETAENLPELSVPATVNVRTLENWLGYLKTNKIEKQWQSLTKSGIKTVGEDFHVGGIQLGNVWIGVQPPLGLAGDPMRLMFERDLTPHPQYAAFYTWLQQDFQADAVLHFGMHGTVEWLPGSPLGNTSYSWSDILLGNLPHLYVYAANNPSESILAKRRGYGVLVSHNVPPYGRAGLYKELITLRELIAEFREDPQANRVLQDAILTKITDTGIATDCPLPELKAQGLEFTPENARLFSNAVLDRYFVTVYDYLQILENRLFSSGLHVLGQQPQIEDLSSYLAAYFGKQLSPELIEQIAADALPDTPQIETLAKRYPASEPLTTELLEEAMIIRRGLTQTTDELTNLLRGLNGEYIPPAPGGDLLRDGPGALPTGRNIHALDPYRMPSPAAYERGRAIGRKLIAQNLEDSGEYPETVAVMLWGLDAIKTKGESLGILLELVGAAPVKEGTGRIVRYELIPLEQMDHPRIDILGNLSGIFRDSFVNIIELLDDLFLRATEADEPPEQNFIRKHALVLKTQGIENVSARLFSNPSGDYGSLVNDRVVDSNWESGNELGDTWRDRNAFSYGRADKGQARPEVLNTLLQSTGRIVQQIDSVEYGLTDIQEYYANTGALKQAAEQRQGKRVTASFVESFSQDTTPRKLEEVLRMEYRTKLLNPKWAEAMADQGSGGAYEISQRMTALVGWGGTTGFQDNWVYDQAAQTYALDETMANRLRQANPEAFRNIVGRMIEANGRGIWQAEEETLERLQDLYDIADETLEGVAT